MTHTTTEPARDVIGDLEEGDVIRVPQYENALKVGHVGDVGGDPYLGIEFVQNPTGATKSLIVNENSGLVYLTAGTTDKGEVETIEVVTSRRTEGR